MDRDQIELGGGCKRPDRATNFGAIAAHGWPQCTITMHNHPGRSFQRPIRQACFSSLMVCLVWNRAEPAILGQLTPIGANRDQINFVSGQNWSFRHSRCLLKIFRCFFVSFAWSLSWSNYSNSTILIWFWFDFYQFIFMSFYEFWWSDFNLKSD